MDIKKILKEEESNQKKIELDNQEKDREHKKHLKNIFKQYCLNSLKDGRKMDWMKEISLEKAKKIILEEHKQFNENI